MFNSIEAVRSTCAKYYKVDLHIHSPLSFDWENHSAPAFKRNSLLDPAGGGFELMEGGKEAFERKKNKYIDHV